MYGEINLLSLSSADIYKYSHHVMDKIFSNEEFLACIVEPSSKSSFKAFDLEKLGILKSKHKTQVRSSNTNFYLIYFN